jgi:hypothetical protein
MDNNIVVTKSVESMNEEILKETIDTCNETIPTQTVEKLNETVFTQTLEKPNETVFTQTVEKPNETVFTQTNIDRIDQSTPFKNEDANNEIIQNKKLDINIIGFSGKIGSGKNYIGEQVLGKYLESKGYRVHSLGFADQIKYEIGIRRNILVDEKIKYEKNEYENKICNAGIINLIRGWVNKTNNFVDVTNYFLIYLQYSSNLLGLSNINFKNKLTHRIQNEHTEGAISAIEDNKRNYDLVFKDKPNYVRLKLQKYAEQREMDEYIWINSLHLRMMNILNKSYDKTKDVFIITDVRFKNEISFIKNMEGIVVKIDKDIKATNETSNEYLTKINNHVSETELDNVNSYDTKIKNTFDNNVNIKNVLDIIFK